MTDPSDARARIKAIQLCRRRSDADIDFLLCHIAGLEGEAKIKDARARIAETFFDADCLRRRLEDGIVDALLEACGVDPHTPDAWPMGDMTFDDYDSSFEFHGTTPGWLPTLEQFTACWALGFSQAWICYTDGTERYCGSVIGELKPTNRSADCDDTRQRRRLQERITQLESEAKIKDAYAYELAKERDALDTQLRDALERLALLEKG